MNDYYPVVNEGELETPPTWWRCLLCGGIATRFQRSEYGSIALCDNCCPSENK